MGVRNFDKQIEDLHKIIMAVKARSQLMKEISHKYDLLLFGAEH